METAEQIAKMSRKLFVKPLNSIEDKCNCGCGYSIEEHHDNRYRIGGEQVTRDCYFRALSNHVDNHPIITPRVYN